MFNLSKEVVYYDILCSLIIDLIISVIANFPYA